MNILKRTFLSGSIIQNFLEISVKINKTFKLFKINNNYMKENYCKYIIINISVSSVFLVKNLSIKEILTKNYHSKKKFKLQNLSALKTLKINPYIKIYRNKNYIYIKNRLTSEIFRINNTCLEEVNKFKKKSNKQVCFN